MWFCHLLWPLFLMRIQQSYKWLFPCVQYIIFIWLLQIFFSHIFYFRWCDCVLSRCVFLCTFLQEVWWACGINKFVCHWVWETSSLFSSNIFLFWFFFILLYLFNFFLLGFLLVYVLQIIESLLIYLEVNRLFLGSFPTKYAIKPISKLSNFVFCESRFSIWFLFIPSVFLLRF